MDLMKTVFVRNYQNEIHLYKFLPRHNREHNGPELAMAKNRNMKSIKLKRVFMRYLWRFAYRLYNWCEDRRPAGGF